jgi:alkanesulfonate monooxygenase
MGIELIGMIGVKPDGAPGASVHVIGGGIAPDFLVEFAQAHEESGFDQVLVGYSSTSAEGFQVAHYAAQHTERLKFLIAHRPGFVAPTLAARKAATFDCFTGGRLSMHIITGGSDTEQRRDGDYLDHDARYRRTDEYLDILRKTWESEKPFDYDGEFYRLERAVSDVKPVQKPSVPLYFGGMSPAALAVGAKHCDCFALWGEPLAAVKAKMEEVRTEAAKHGRNPRFSVSLRPIIAPTEAEAWDRAHAILESIERTKPASPLAGGAARPEAEGSRRLLRFAEEADVHDKRLWMAIAKATGAPGNTTALVGTPEQVAESMLDYYDIGVTTLLIRGFDPLNDAREYGKELIPLVRDEVARRERHAVTA